MLIFAGADVDALNRGGRYPLDNAVSKSSADTALLLISAGAEVRYDAGRDTLYWALKAGHKELASRLISGGANVNYCGSRKTLTLLERAFTDQAKGCAEQLIAMGAKPSPRALHWSVLRGDTAVTELLIRAGADVNALVEGKTALSRVTIEPPFWFCELTETERREMIKFLKDNGAKV